MRVALPFDGSLSAKHALDYVIALAKSGGKGSIDVHLVNVQDVAVGFDDLFDDAADVAARLASSSLAAGEKVLAKPASALKRAGLKTKSTVLLGDAATCIAEYIKDNRCEAVVMGTRGLGQVVGLVMGSVASKVIHLVKVPVTLVK